MTFTHHCPHCHSKLNIEVRHCGRTVKCPKCQSALTIPEATAVMKKVPPAAGPTSSARDVQTPAELPKRLGDTRQPMTGRRYTLWVMTGTIAVVLLGGIVYWLNPGGEGTGDAGIAHSGQPTAGQSLAANGSLPPPGEGFPVLASENGPRVMNPPAGHVSDGIGPSPLKILPVDTSGWESFPPKNPFGIYVRFPSPPEDFNLLEDVEPGKNREFGEAVLKSMKPTALRSKANGRAFSLTLARLELSSMPVEVYLERATENYESMHLGFKRQANYVSTVDPPVARDSLMRSDKGTRIVRIAHSGEHAISVFVDGPLNMPYEDALAQGFLASLRIADRPIPPMKRLASEIVMTPPPTKAPLAPGVDPVWPIHRLKQQPLSNDWQLVSGSHVKFQVQLPGKNFARPDLNTLFLKSPSFDVLLNGWKESTTGEYDILYLDQGSRRYIVFGTKVPTVGLEWYEVGEKANETLLYLEPLFTQPNTTGKILEDLQEQKGWFRQTQQCQISRSVIRQRRICGQYAFLLVLDSDQELHWESAEVQTFFQSVQPPVDAMTFE